MSPAEFRAAAHVVVDLMADYLETVESRDGLPDDRARVAAAAVPGERARDAPSRSTRSSRTTDASSSPTPRTGSTRASSPTSRRPRPGPGSSARCSRRPSARTRCCGGPRRSAPSSRRSSSTGCARRSGCPTLRRAAHRHGVDVVAHRARRRTRGGGRRRGGRRAWPVATDLPAAPRLRVRRGAQLDREGVHDARASAGRRSSGSRPTSASRCDPTPCPRRSPRTVPPAAGRSRSSRRSGRPRRPRSTRSRPSPRSPSARGCGCTSMRRMPGSVAMLPERAGAFDGWERADSIVVNPHKWLFTPLDASLLLTRRMADAARGVQPRARVPADARPDDAGPRLQRVHAAARSSVPCAQAVDAAALVRARGASAADRGAPRDGAGVRRMGRRRSGLGAPGAGAVLDGLLPLAPGRPRPWRRGARRRATRRSWTR